jgi:hypothetical protein
LSARAKEEMAETACLCWGWLVRGRGEEQETYVERRDLWDEHEWDGAEADRE